MTPEQFRELIQKYKDGCLSDAEWTALRAELAAGRHRDILEEDIRNVFENSERHPLWNAEKEEEVWEKIKVRTEPIPTEPVYTEPARPGGPLRWLRRTAAAAAVLFVAIAISLLYTRNEKPVPVVANPARPMPPGSIKAWLLLANGQRVILEDVKKGDVTTQGGTRIIKLDSGVLAYHPTAAAAGHPEAGQLLYNTIVTPRGGQYQLILPDGTKVWLNAATSLRFPISFTGSDRRVELTGEAYFEVKHIPGMPFRVQTGQRSVEDIGTSFNINAYSDEPSAKVTLIEGAAKVIGKKNLTLRPGQQAHWQAEEEETLTDNADTEEVLAWKNGQISFMNPDFSCIMRQISRWYNVDIRYTGAVPKARFFGIVSRNVYLPTILEFFEHNNIHIKQEGRTLIIAP